MINTIENSRTEFKVKLVDDLEQKFFIRWKKML